MPPRGGAHQADLGQASAPPLRVEGINGNDSALLQFPAKIRLILLRGGGNAKCQEAGHPRRQSAGNVFQMATPPP